TGPEHGPRALWLRDRSAVALRADAAQRLSRVLRAALRRVRTRRTRCGARAAPGTRRRARQATRGVLARDAPEGRDRASPRARSASPSARRARDGARPGDGADAAELHRVAARPSSRDPAHHA